MNPFAFVTGNWQRLLAYGIAALAVVLTVWMDGYFEGQQELFEYQAEQAQSAVAIVVKIKEADTHALTNLQHDYDALRELYDTAESERGLGAAAGSLAACTADPSGVSAVQGDDGEAADRVRGAARMLDDVEGAVLAILAAGDHEIAKCRRLYERDVSASKAAE